MLLALNATPCLTCKILLQGAVLSHIKEYGDNARTVVFSGTVATAEDAARVLRQSGIMPLVYHREVPQSQRDLIVQESARRQVLLAEKNIHELPHAPIPAAPYLMEILPLLIMSQTQIFALMMDSSCKFCILQEL